MRVRDYPEWLKEVWAKEIAEAEDRVRRVEAGEEVLPYDMVIDPEDFLDLCAGKWNGERP